MADQSLVGQKRGREEIDSERRRNADNNGKNYANQNPLQRRANEAKAVSILYESKNKWLSGPNITKPFGGCKGLIAAMLSHGVIVKNGASDFYKLAPMVASCENIEAAISRVILMMTIGNA